MTPSAPPFRAAAPTNRSATAGEPTRVRNGWLRALRAERVKLTRPRLLAGTAASVLVVAIGGTALGVISAPAEPGPRQTGDILSVQALGEPGGGTAVFSQTMAFTYAFLLAAFIANIAAEFTSGTFRTMLLQQPGRFQLLLGKLFALLTFASLAAIVAEAASWLTARPLAPGQGIQVSAWTSGEGLTAAADDLGRAVLFLICTAVFATMVGVLARSVPIGVGVGLVWSGPVENIIAQSWDPSERYFPGLLLRAVIAPGSTDTPTGRALLTLAAYSAIALTVIGVALNRRDVTS